ncbi:hypothetical protein D9C73_013030 [Collichthys lucidus]|uniref:Uncharacterized protein n=1 Tax=Collichthys lucidus TaxID=240159 RepID=A0A4U5USN2_COLLU|nr:hypothetical protein D9C73_013030 [Collichthys lucidus]
MLLFLRPQQQQQQQRLVSVKAEIPPQPASSSSIHLSISVTVVKSPHLSPDLTTPSLGCRRRTAAGIREPMLGDTSASCFFEQQDAGRGGVCLTVNLNSHGHTLHEGHDTERMIMLEKQFESDQEVSLLLPVTCDVDGLILLLHAVCHQTRSHRTPRAVMTVHGHVL